MKKNNLVAKIKNVLIYCLVLFLLSLNIGPVFNYLKFFSYVYAQSSWTNYASNPTKSGQVGYPAVVKKDSTYHLWYTKTDGTDGIFYATSANGTSWTDQNSGNAVNITLNQSSYITNGVAEPTVVWDSNESKFYMVFIGYDGSDVSRFITVESTDGISWDQGSWGATYPYALEINSTASSWDDESIYKPFLIEDGSSYALYYTAATTVSDEDEKYIGYVSESGTAGYPYQFSRSNLGLISFNGNTDNNIILAASGGADFDGEGIFGVSVIKSGPNYIMFWAGYNGTGTKYKVGFANASNATEWTKYGSNPVFANGSDDAYGPCVILDSSIYKMWYDPGGDGINYATASEDGDVGPQTASVTIPATGTYYNASTIPSEFSGGAADGVGGEGLNANTTTFYIKKNSDTTYWNGSSWTAWSLENELSTTHTATIDDSEVAWTDNTTLPSWASGETYIAQAEVTNKANNVLYGDYSIFYYDSVNPATASVTTPSNGSSYTSSTMPTEFSGSVADDASGLGMEANSATFYIKNSSDEYWNGSSWTGSETWLSATNNATSDSTSETWTDSIALPSWTNGTYYSKVKATDRAGNTYEGSEISYTYTESSATSTPNLNNYYNSSNWIEANSINGTATGTNIDHVYLKIQRLSDSYYWDGSDWASSDPGWLNATGTTTWTYSLTSSNLTNGVTYTVSTYAHDDGGDGDTSTDSFMYNSLDWTQYRINPLAVTTSKVYPSVILDSSTFKMWYVYGSDIYYSTSTNGINWDYQGKVLDNGSEGEWDSSFVTEPWVIKDGSTYKMWYGGSADSQSDMRIGYATSSDGETWTKSGSNPVLSNGSGGDWDDRSVRRPVVIQDGSTYKMWYDGTQGDNTAYNIGYATSSDGVSWSKYGSNPVLERGSETGNDWDYSNVWAMSVLKRGEAYEMYYSGNGASGSGIPYQIGHAYSTDGTNWVEYDSNPVITTGVADTWNDEAVYSSMVYLDESGDNPYYKMWYNGSDGSAVKMGYATLDAPADSTKPSSSPDFDIEVAAGYMAKVGSTYYSGPQIWSNTIGPYGTASDAWGIEEVDITLGRDSDSKYWDGDSWETSLSWIAATGSSGYTSWYYGINGLSNFDNDVVYTVQSRATDGSQSANVQTTYGSENFTWDSEDPTLSMDALNNYYNSAGLPSSFSGTSSDNVSGINNVSMTIKRSSDNKYWDGDSWETSATSNTATGTTSWSLSDSDLLVSIRNSSDGVTYTIGPTATDNVDNTSAATTDSFTYDNTAPSVSITNLSRSAYSSSNWPDVISGSASDATSGVASVDLTIQRDSDDKYWDGDSWETSATWLLATGTTSWSYAFADTNLTTGANYTITSRATDNASNTKTTNKTFIYDDTTPSAPTVYDGIQTGVEVDEVESLTTLSANWSLSLTPASGVSKYQYAIGTTAGGTEVVSWTNNGTSTNVTKSGLSLTLGQKYYFTVRVVNGAATTGTAGNSSGQTTVDETAPSVSLTTTPDNPTDDNTPTIGGTATDVMTNIFRIQYRVDSGSWVTVGTSYSAKSVDFSFTTDVLSDGEHTIYVRATDSSSNTSSPVSTTFTVDASAPDAPTIDSPKSGEVIGTKTPVLDGGAEANTTVVITINSETKNYTCSVNASGRWTFEVPDELEEGSHTLEVKVRDEAGNDSDTTSISFTIDTTADETVDTTPTSAPTTETPTVLLEEEEEEISDIDIEIETDKIKIPIIKDKQKIEVLVNSEFGVSVKPKLDKPIKFVTTKFEGKTYQLEKKNGTYYTKIFSPGQKGTYKMVATIVYEDGTTEEVEIEVLVDPYGYVYTKDNKGQEVRIKDAKVTLYVWEDNQWKIWEASQYDQNNPQMTNQQGEYAFMVPAGRYKIEAELEGYKKYASEELTINEGKPINLNIEMYAIGKYAWIWYFLGVIVVIIAGWFIVSKNKSNKNMV